MIFNLVFSEYMQAIVSVNPVSNLSPENCAIENKKGRFQSTEFTPLTHPGWDIIFVSHGFNPFDILVPSFFPYNWCSCHSQQFDDYRNQ